MKYELIQLNEERNVTLTAYITETEGEYRYVTARPAVIVIPGGGYQFCSDREADPVAMPFLAAGYDVFILRYSVGENAVWPTPLQDYEDAYEYILSRADEWKVMKDKIAVIGFSAGGHLAAAAATMAKHRPQAAILGYPVIREDTVHECEETAPGIPEHVSYDTCPCFIFATRTDSVVPIQNTIDMLNALNQYQVSFECHIYAYGPHGFSTGDSSVQSVDTIIANRAKDWVGDSIKWLRDVMGEFGNDGLSKPVCKAHVSEDGLIQAGAGDTAIFIHPGVPLRATDALITNFHLPQSTLLMLVSALMGREETLRVYEEAVRERYRFFSFGDAMMID